MIEILSETIDRRYSELMSGKLSKSDEMSSYLDLCISRRLYRKGIRILSPFGSIRDVDMLP